MSEPETYEFYDAESMLGIVNARLAKADEKPLFTLSDDGDSEFTLWERSDEYNAEQVDTHKVVFSEQTGERFGVVTDEYEIINPPQFLGPLASELKERDRSFNGQFRQWNGGARGYGEVLFTDGGFWPADRQGRQDPVRTGITFRWSHDGGISVKASAFAQDGQCENTMRHVTDSVHVKHAGDVDERVDFGDEWNRLLNQLGVFNERLEAVISEAVDFELLEFDGGADEWITDDILQAAESLNALEDLDVPPHLNPQIRDGLNALFELHGFPRYLAMMAADRAMFRLTNSERPYKLTAWDAYSAATYAVTHTDRFETAAPADDKYQRLATDLLMNPHGVLLNGEREAATRLSPDDESQEHLFEEDVGDAARVFKEREEQLQQALSGD